ncbi:hypothetical protein Scep_022580 [Stephania cephalantha]|uniref:Uncharacterized protein n=1 Tax=Stephania cephalantha TaxID=152367 RepID=A0AAP0I2A3_9MAGN
MTSARQQLNQRDERRDGVVRPIGCVNRRMSMTRLRRFEAHEEQSRLLQVTYFGLTTSA